MFRRIFVASLLAGLICLLPAWAQAKIRFVTIGTGSVTGVYYPAGKAIAKMVNLKRKQYGMKVTVESTGGSVFNINAVLAGDLTFGVAQSDRQYEAVHGLAEWKTSGPRKGLRSVFSLHAETFFLVAADRAGIKGYGDLKGKIVSVGNPGSGMRQNFLDILAVYGLKFADFARAEGLKAAESAKMLQDSRIQAFVYTVGSPNGLIKEATSGRLAVRFIAAGEAQLKALTAKHPYYVAAPIPLKYYPKAANKKPPLTFAVKATLVTRASVPQAVVYAVVKEVFGNLARFKRLHQAFGGLNKKDMLKGLSAPLHPGAVKYYKEAGLM